MNAKLVHASILAAALAAGCTSDPRGGEPEREPRAEASAAPAPPPAPAQWTDDFQRQAVIVAEEIRIVGPRGLLEHVAVQQDPANHTYDVETTTQGLRVAAVAGPNALQPIRGQLDALSLAATRSLTLLESIQAVDVVVEASGDVYYRDVEAGKESRSPSLRLVGRSGR